MFPNFLIVGVAKGGTTSLYYYLLQHPEVQIPKKETFYFIKDFYEKANNNTQPFYRDRSKIIFTEEDYHHLYEKCNAKAVGEVSTCYYYFHEIAVPRIRQKLGDIKIIFILRNPVERAFSGYNFFKRDLFETLTFEEALKDEESRKLQLWDFMWYYASLGFYSKAVRAFMNHFTQVKIFLYEELEQNPEQFMKELYGFIGVDTSFIPDVKVKYNISDSQGENFWFKYFIKNNTARRFLKPLVLKILPDQTKRREIKHKLRQKSDKKELISKKFREKLKNYYRSDILELQKIINKDLSNWLH